MTEPYAANDNPAAPLAPDAELFPIVPHAPRVDPLPPAIAAKLQEAASPQGATAGAMTIRIHPGDAQRLAETIRALGRAAGAGRAVLTTEPSLQSEACRLREERDRLLLELDAKEAELQEVRRQRDAARKLVAELGQLAAAAKEIAAGTPDEPRAVTL